MKQTIIFLMGVSGSGKTTVMNDLIHREGIKYVPSYTTRDPRPGEVSGERYIFISHDEFHQSIENHEFLEYATVHQTNYYGTKIADIISVLEQDMIPIKEIDMLGLEQLCTRTDLPFAIKSIFLDIPDAVMIDRITSRGQTPQEEIDRRIQSSQHERDMASKICDHTIQATGTIPEVIDRVWSTIRTYLI